jgi:hypothetical protein
MAGYSYMGGRRWGLSADVQYNRARWLSATPGVYGGVAGSVAVSRQLEHGFHLTGTYVVRDYSSHDFTGYNRTVQTVTLGVAYSPGELPLRVW